MRHCHFEIPLLADFVLAYVHKGWGDCEEAPANVEILLNSLKSVERLCPNLQL